MMLIDMTMISNEEKGQSLIEVLIALAVVLIVLVALVSAVTVSVQSSDYSRKKAQASAYANQGMENIRVYRDSNWASFLGLANGTYGLAGSVPSGGCPGLANLASVFIRCVSLERSLIQSPPADGDLNGDGIDDYKVKVRVTVSWTDSKGTHTSDLVSYFTQWQ